LYGAGGYLHEQLTGTPGVCGVVNNPQLKKVLGNEVNSITWFNGLIQQIEILMP
jgi:hypothetical protein